jgi:lauroyl/myristoyl acyltransferase
VPWLNFALGVLDTAAVTHYSKQDVIDRVKIEGEEHIRRALEMGKGVVGISAHLGPVYHDRRAFSGVGVSFQRCRQASADERFARLTDDYRTRLGLHTIPPSRGAKRCAVS